MSVMQHAYGMVGLMWLKETGAKGNSEDVQNKCACGRRWNKCAIHGLALRARLVAWFWLVWLKDKGANTITLELLSDHS
jgi:hypothetical protein